MDEQWLRDLLDRTTAGEPPIGSLAVDSLRAGIKRRRRRRAQGTVACVAAVALIGTVAVAATGAARHPGTGAANHPAPGPAKVTGPTTTYVLSGEGNLYAIPNSTKLRSKKILLPGGRQFMAITPNGKTLYDVSWGKGGEPPSYVIPISTATNRPGRPVRVACDPYAVVVTPDGKTVWVGSSNWVTPISTATDRAGTPITFRGNLVAIVVGATP